MINQLEVELPSDVNMSDSGGDSQDCDVGVQEDVFDEDGEAPNPFENSSGTTKLQLKQRYGAVQPRLCCTEY